MIFSGSELDCRLSKPIFHRFQTEKLRNYPLHNFQKLPRALDYFGGSFKNIGEENTNFHSSNLKIQVLYWKLKKKLYDCSLH